MNEQNPTQRLTDELEHDLTARYGVMLGSNALWWGFHAHLDTQSTNTWTAIPR